jgi:hypothetical protein
MKSIFSLGKKAEDSSNFTQFIIIAIFVVIFAFMVFLYVTDHFMADILYTNEGLDEEIIISRVFFSPSCFVYMDENSNRAYPMVIDFDKFTQERLDECMQTQKRISFTLYVGGTAKEIHTKGWDGTFTEQYRREVLVKDGDIEKGVLFIATDLDEKV